MKFGIMKVLLGSVLSLNAVAQISEPFQLNVSNYQDYVKSKEHLTFVAIAKVQEGKEEEFVQIVDSVINEMRRQKGNISYNFHQSKEDSSEFIFVEEWRSGKSLDAHMNSKVVGSFFSKAGPLFENGFPKIIIMDKK